MLIASHGSEISHDNHRRARARPGSGWISFLRRSCPTPAAARVQQLIAEEKALVSDAPAKPSLKLRGGEQITILGDPVLPPLRAIAEDIPLDVVYEDADLAVVNKPAGMMVHAGAGATDDERNRGTLVNALLHRFGALSEVGGELRPGIVHRLDKETSGLIVVAKNDVGASQAGGAVLRTQGEEAVCRAGARLAGKGSRHDQRGHQPRRDPAHAHDDQGPRRSHGGVALRGASSESSRRTASSRWSRFASKPDAPIRFACTCRPSGIRWWAMRCMVRRVSCA